MSSTDPTFCVPKIRLGEISSKIGSGATPRGGKESYKTEGISLIRSMNVYDSEFDYSGLAYIDEDQAKSLNNVRVEEDDVLLNITGASVARCCLVPKNVLPARVNQHVAIVRIRKTQADPYYVHYCLISPRYKDSLLSIAQGGATREALTKEKIEEFRIPLPPLPTQQKIAAILSAYDDLIENNLRRIKRLEEMAQNLYREWFIKFRFPGHQNARFVDSPLGRIPEGWEVVTFGQLYTTASGGTPSRKVEQYYGGAHPWVKTRELNDGFIFETEENITDLGLRKSSAKLFPTNTVILAIYGATIGKLGIISMPSATNQACVAILPQTDGFGRAFAFLFLRENKDKLISLGQGAAQQNISQVVLKKYGACRPPLNVLNTFSELSEPLLDQIKNLQQKNTTLRRTRDLLLPRLISGEVDVSELDIAIPEEAV